jgi:Right handed beta helix region
LMPGSSGSAGALIVFGSYGQGDATLPQGVWFRGPSYLGFEHLNIDPTGNLQGTGNDITVLDCSMANDGLGINANGNDWLITGNTIDHTGDSGMLLTGDSFTITDNTITNTGLDSSITYGKHGIYLKVSNAVVSGNVITNFSSDGISARYRNSLITNNQISNGAIGIGWFQYDPVAGTSHWTHNTITGTSAAGVYVSASDIGGSTRESFDIEDNTFRPSSGALMDLRATTGTYQTLGNTLL